MHRHSDRNLSTISRPILVLLCLLTVFGFTVSSATAGSPPAPASLSPANGAQVTVPFTISWAPVSDPSGIVAYNWQVSPSSSMSPVIMLNSTSGQTQDTVSGLAAGTYFWRVQAVNGAFVQGAWSAPQSFTVTGSGAGEPGTPTLNPPQGGRQFHPMEVIYFTWNAVPGAASYIFDAATDPNFPVASTFHFDNIPNTSYSIEFGDSVQGNFSARVRAVTANGILGVPSNLQTFSVFFNNPLPPPPSPLAPANGATVQLPVTLSWTDVPNPQPSGYVLEVAKDSGFSNIEYSNNQITGPSWTITSLTAGTKFWHVLSTQGDSAPGVPANTAWSATRSFVVPSTPPAVGSITLSSASPSNGDTETFWIQLTAPAPAGGAVIKLTSSDPSAAPIPASVTMPAGFAFNQYQFQIGQVTTPTPVTLTASLNGTSASANLTVQPPTLKSLTISPSQITGGGVPQAIVMLSGNAPAGGVTVNLSSSSAAASPPAAVTVAAGSPSAVVNIPTSAVTTNTPVTITASANGISRQAQFTLTPQIAPASLALSPATTGSSTCCSSGTVTIAAAAPGDTELFLSSSNPSVATVPTAVVVPQGSTAGGFFIQTVVVNTTTTVTISVTGAGVTKTATLTVVPPGGGTTPTATPGAGTVLSSLTLSPTSVKGGDSSTGTARLSAPAPPGGAVVTLSSGNTAVATVPSNVTIPAGSTSATFRVRTQRVSATISVTISGKYGGATKSASLSVTR